MQNRKLSLVVSFMRRSACALSLYAGLAGAIVADEAQAFAKIQEVATGSGVSVWLLEDHSLPVIAVRGAVERAGSAYVAQGQEGLAMMAASLISEGAGDMDYKAFHEALDMRGIRLGADVGMDTLSFSMDTITKHYAQAFDLLGLALGKPRIDDEAVERQRRDVLAQLTLMQSKPEYVAGNMFVQHAFAGHPYVREVDGTLETVRKLTSASIKQFLQQHVAQDRLVIAIAGDMTPEQVKDAMVGMLKHIPQQAADASPEAAQVVMQAQGQQVRKALDVPQTAVLFGLPAIKRQDANFYAAYVMNYMLGGGGLSSRLSQSIREKAGLSYYVYMNLQTYDATGVLQGAFASRTEQVDKAIGLLKKELQRAQTQGFSQQELDDAKKFIIGSFPVKLDSSKDLAGFMLSMQVQGLGKEYLEQRNQLIQDVQLTQVNALAKQLLDVKKLLIVRVGKESVKKHAATQTKTSKTQ
jgi:zinc protease